MSYLTEEEAKKNLCIALPYVIEVSKNHYGNKSQYPHPNLCTASECKLGWRLHTSKCTTCNGSGETEDEFPFDGHPYDCSICGGSGVADKNVGFCGLAGKPEE